MKHRHTKIVATVGPATASPEGIRRLLGAGVNVLRLNMAHGDHTTHADVVRWARQFEVDRPIGLLADLAGPKIRIGRLPGPLTLEDGTGVVIAPEATASRDELPSTYAALAADVRPGDRILLDDGQLELVVDRIADDRVYAEVVVGGLLRPNKGLNLPGVRVSAPALTEKDRADLRFALDIGVHFIGLSFVRRPEDILELRRLIGDGPEAPLIVAKIEKDTALEHLDEIMEVTDCVMVARGDLGVELPFHDVPVAQKRIISRALFHGRPVITATQMLESMISNARPTRAEANDVATSVFDSSDAVMLSGETAVGSYPVQTVAMMNEILKHAQEYHDDTRQPARITWTRAHTEAALGAAVREILATVDVAAVAVYTCSGTTARILSKYRLPCPIIGISQHRSTVRRMCLYYGVDAVLSDVPRSTRDVLIVASETAVERGLARAGDRLVVVTGRPIGRSGHANTVVIHEIPVDVREASYSMYEPPPPEGGCGG